jgi:hypothetical protein
MSEPCRHLLESAARQHVPDVIDLFPRIAARLERRTFKQALLARPALIVLAALLALGLLSGAVYAVGRSLGYIPGLGIVEEGTVLRSVPAPVVVERQGITLTILQGWASPDRTVLTYRVDNIPESALARDFAEGQTPPPTCYPRDGLRLPDGTIHSPTGGQGGGWQLGFQFRDVFDPLPAGVNQATLLVSCLLDTAPGMAPENWEIPLTFVPSPPDLTMVPVLEITPTAPPTAKPSSPPPSAPAPSPISIERSIELDDGYILIGSFHVIASSGGLATSPYIPYVRITDANGQDVAYDYASDIDLPAADEHAAPWAYKIAGKAHAWPLTLTVDALNANLPDPQARFDFDTGPAPQAGQQWTIGQSLQIGSYTVHVLTATRTASGYDFTFQADPGVSGLALDIRGASQYIAPAGGGGGGGPQGSLSAGVDYTDQVPEGKLTVVITGLTASIPGPWSAQWAPENPVQVAPTAASAGAEICVTDDLWNQALRSEPADIPPGLPGKFVLFGPSPDGSMSGIKVLNLADEGLTFLGKGSRPIGSPDGTKIVFASDAGLSVYDLSSGQSTALAGTDPSDYRMVWSPDSRRIAFLRIRTDQMMVIGADGSGQRQVRDNSAVYHLLVGWADAEHLLITKPAADGQHIQSLDLTDGTTQDLFPISSNKADTVTSSDGQWIAFTNSLGGMLGNGLYISRPDGSERRMMAALKGLALYFPIWSPDDRWLILSLPDPSDPVDQAAQVLVELDSCRMTRLPALGGEVTSWMP